MVKKVWEREAEKKAKVARERAAQGHLPALPQQHWAPSHGLSPVQTGHEGCNVQLPQFGTSAVQGSQQGRHLALVRPGQGQLVPVAEKRPGDGLIAAGKVAGKASRAVSIWSWRNRWNLTPAVASALAMSTASTEPMLALTALMAVGGGSALMPDEIKGRKFLSTRERQITAAWAAGGFVWTLGTLPGFWGLDPTGVAIFGGLTGVQALAWCASRRIRGEGWKAQLLGLFGIGAGGKGGAAEPKLSQKALDLLETWAQAMTNFNAPEKLLNSQIVPDSMREPNKGTIAFTVELRDTVHAEDAVGDELRKTLERQMRLGVDSVNLAVNPNDSGQIKVTIVHDREALKINTAWTGELSYLEDGSTALPLAITPDGVEIDSFLNNRDGIEHMFITGAIGTGKSNTVSTAILPGVYARHEVVFYVDGGEGSSASHLAGAADWWADSAEAGRAAIAAAYMVTKARKRRRAKQGLSRWKGPKGEKDPALTLVLEEGTTIVGWLGNAGLPINDGKHITFQDMVKEIKREGRKLGCRVIQLTQDAKGTDAVGGREARDLAMSGGTVVAHRATGSVSNMLTASSTSEQIDLRSLPPESGWAAIVRRGQVVAKKARVRYAEPEAVIERLKKMGEVRGLEGADAEAAAQFGYASRLVGRVHAATVEAAQAEHDAGTTTAEVISIHKNDHAAGELHEIAAASGHSSPAATDHAPAPDAYESVAAGVSISEADQIAAQFPELARLSGAARAGQEAGALNRFQVLEILREEPEGLKFSGILDKVSFPKGTLSRALKRLAQDGEAHKTDDGHWHAGPEAA